MAAKDRIQAIKQMIVNDEKVAVSNSGEIFQITGETIRRDLEKLEDEGSLTRTYGGTVLNTATLAESIRFHKRVSSFYKEKQLVTRKALPFIDNKTTVAANSNSTVMGLLKLLQDRSDLTLLTNSTEVIHILTQSEIRVASTGGELNGDTLSLRGRITEKIISRCHADTIVMSCRGFDINSDTLDPNETEAGVEKIMIRRTTEVALLVDHSKFGRKAFVQLADFSHTNYIMADKSPGAEWVAFCKDNNIQLVWQFKYTLSVLFVPTPKNKVMIKIR